MVFFELLFQKPFFLFSFFLGRTVFVDQHCLKNGRVVVALKCLFERRKLYKRFSGASTPDGAFSTSPFEKLDVFRGISNKTLIMVIKPVIFVDITVISRNSTPVRM